MNTLKNSLGRMLLPLTIIFSLSSCYDESAPPGCETVKKPVLTQTVVEVQEGETILIPMPRRPDDNTTVTIVGPKDVDVSYYSENATVYNATQEKAGIYKIYNTRNYCRSEAAEVLVKVTPPAVKCTIPDNVIRFNGLGYDLKYNNTYCGGSHSNDNKFSISGGNSQSDFELFFGTATRPTSARSYPISSKSLSFMGADEVMIRVLLGGRWYYPSSEEKGRVNVTIENGNLVATFCDMKFYGDFTLTGSGRLICRQ